MYQLLKPHVSAAEHAQKTTCLSSELIKAHVSCLSVNMATASTPTSLERHRMAAVQLTGRLRDCWETDIDWEKYPKVLGEVQNKLFF